MSLAKCFTSLLFTLTVCFFLNVNICRANPGIRVQITKKGLDYEFIVSWACNEMVENGCAEDNIIQANELALDKMYEELKSYKFPVFSKGGSATYTLYDVKASRVSRPTGQVVLVPGQGLKWSVSISGYHLSAKFRVYKKIGWFKVRKTVSLTIDIRQVALELTLKATKAPHGGLYLKATHCRSNADVKISSSNILVKLVLKFFRSKINSMIEKKLCDSAIHIINYNVAKTLSNFPVIRRIRGGYIFDYRFVSDPVFTSTYLQTNHKAAVLDKNQNGHFPFAPRQLPNINKNTKMIYFIISDYVLNTWLYTVYRDNHTMLNLNREKAKSQKQRLMFRTTCPDSLCVGTLMPKISQMYPNSYVEMHFAASKNPSVHFKPNHIQLRVPAKLDFVVVKSDGASVKFFSAELVLFTELKTTISGGNILFTVTNTTLTLGEISGATPGSFTVEALTKILKIVVKLVQNVLPGQQFPLVVPSNTLLLNPTLQVAKNAIIVASDFRITSL